MEDFDWSGQEPGSASPDGGRVSPSWTALDAKHVKLGPLTPDSCLRVFLHHRPLSLTCFNGSALAVCQASILCLHLHVLHLRPLLLPSVLGKGGSPSSSPGLPGRLLLRAIPGPAEALPSSAGLWTSLGYQATLNIRRKQGWPRTASSLSFPNDWQVARKRQWEGTPRSITDSKVVLSPSSGPEG